MQFICNSLVTDILLSICDTYLNLGYISGALSAFFLTLYPEETGLKGLLMSRSLYVRLMAGVLCAFTWLSSASGEPGNGTVSGTATDPGASTLQGARVQLNPIGKQATTDQQGQFRFAEVAPGDYTVTVSYLGFAPFSQAIKVGPGQAVNVSAVLQVASKVEQVVVTAPQVFGQAEALNIERTSDNIVNVLPQNVILSLPNTNIADAVGRLPSVTLERDEGEGKYVQIRGTEPRLNNMTINGVLVPSPEASVRNIKMDVIPAALVDRIEVFKTLLPNQDANAIGGSVNLVTKTPTEKPEYSLTAEGGYTPIQDGRWLNGATGTIGRRFGLNKNLGVVFGGSYDHNNRGIDDLEPTQAIGNFNGNNFALINAEDFRTYKYNRTRYGFAGGVDYNIKPGFSVYVKGLFSDFHDYGSTFVYTPNVGAIVDHNGSQTTFDNTGFMQYREYIRRPDQQVWSVAIGANQDLAAWDLGYQFAISRGSNSGGQDFPTTYFNGPANVQFGLNESNPRIPHITAIDGTNVFDPSPYAISSTVLPNYNSAQLNYQGTISAARRYTIGSHFSTFEFGFLDRNANKYQHQYDQYFDANNTYPMTPFLNGQSNPNYYNNSLPYGPLTSYSKIQSLLASQLSTGFSPNLDKNRIISDPATWNTTENVYAGYLMDSITLGKVRLIGGLRIEGTGSNYTANKVTLNNGAYVSTDPVSGNGGYVNLLPSIQAQYAVEKNTTIRASYFRSLSRANFQDLVPYVQADPNTSPKSLQVGNPALLPTTANNYDLLVDHFFQPLGLLQAGVFYKTLANPIYSTISIVPDTDPNFAGYQKQQSINGPSAHIIGFEAAWQQRLSFLPGLLNGFGVSANYSYTSSQVTFPAGFSSSTPGGQGRIDRPSLQRQAPNTWNLYFTYDKARFSARFAISHNDANIYAYGYVHNPDIPNVDQDPILGIKGPLGDQYLYAHTQYDIQGSYRFYKNVQFVVSGLNLSNEVFGFYTGSSIYPNQREFYQPTVTFGLRWSSAIEQF